MAPPETPMTSRAAPRLVCLPSPVVPRTKMTGYMIDSKPMMTIAKMTEPMPGSEPMRMPEAAAPHAQRKSRTGAERTERSAVPICQGGSVGYFGYLFRTRPEMFVALTNRHTVKVMRP